MSRLGLHKVSNIQDSMYDTLLSGRGAKVNVLCEAEPGKLLLNRRFALEMLIHSQALERLSHT